MNIRTDLALEALASLPARGQPGADTEEEEIEGVRVFTVSVKTPEAARRLAKPIGRYVTLELPALGYSGARCAAHLLAAARVLERFLPREGTVLVCGLGNRNITPDALGPLAAEKVLATRHFESKEAKALGLPSLRPTAVLAPGVLGQTGIETAEILQMAVKALSPAAAVVIDAFAAGDSSRLGRTLQLSDTGICPGSGVANSRKEVSQRTLGIPVVALGVPTVCDLPRKGNTPLMVTPREIDAIVENAAALLAGAVNKALHPGLTEEEEALLF